MSIGIDIVSIRAKIDFATYADNSSPASKTVIEPTGAYVSIIGLFHNGTEGPNAGFILSDSFNVGDVVQLYKSDAVATGECSVSDNNGHDLTSIGPVQVGVIIRKIFSGTGKDWLPIKTA